MIKKLNETPLTMKDIAQMVGVSRQVVSAVLNKKNNCRVSELKRKKILKTAEELNFIPNHSALQLKGVPSKTVAILMSQYPGTIHTELFREFNFLLAQHDYQTFYASLPEDAPPEEVFKEFIPRGIDALIVPFTGHTFKRSKFPIPTVEISRDGDLGFDLEHGGYIVAKHLLEHGHKRIAVVGHIPINNPKIEGIHKACKEYGVKIQENWQVELIHNLSAPDEVLKLIEKEKITAFCATNDYIAGKLIAFLNYRGIWQSGNIAVTGFDGMSFGEFTISPLTTVTLPLKQMANRAVDILLWKIESKNTDQATKTELVKPELFIGSSCGCNKHNLDMLYWEGALPTFETLYNYIEPMPKRRK